MTGRTGHVAVLSILGGLSVLMAAAALHPDRAKAQAADSSSAPIENQALPAPPNTNESGVLGTAAPDAATPNSAAPPVPEAPASTTAPSVAAPTQWLAGHQAQLTVLDKIYGSATTVSATVGTPFVERFLTVTVLACLMRPAGLPADAAAFLQVTDSHAPPGGPPEFRGWIFKAEPALSGMDDPATDISVDGCS
jgi:hypothetical protein